MHYFSYRPGFRSKDSTKPITIYKGSQEIGTVCQVYKNIFIKLLDWFLLRGILNAYEIRDDEGNLRFKSRYLMKLRTQYGAIYYDNNNEKHNFILSDVRKFNHSPIVNFQYKNQDFVIKQEYFGWTNLTQNDVLIAQWKRMNMVVPDEIELRLHDDGYLDDIYLVLGVIHTFFFDEK